MKASQLIITIDGPAGAGKSTLARALAAHLGWTYLDTGAMYRAVGLAAYEAGVDVSDQEALSQVVSSLELDIAPGPEATRVFLNGREVTTAIREPHISSLASRASAWDFVRRAMVSLQQRLGSNGRIVAEGRDMGTVVFPEAGLKFFLDAKPEERAGRRYKELIEMGRDVRLEDVAEDMAQRDLADSTRDLAPLRPADSAVIIDTTGQPPDEVLSRLIEVAEEKI